MRKHRNLQTNMNFVQVYGFVLQKVETCSQMTQITLFNVEEKKPFVGHKVLQMNAK